jgi:hypothetical protein
MADPLSYVELAVLSALGGGAGALVAANASAILESIIQGLAEAGALPEAALTDLESNFPGIVNTIEDLIQGASPGPPSNVTQAIGNIIADIIQRIGGM